MGNSSRCRAKNPAACRSPRCPARRAMTAVYDGARVASSHKVALNTERARSSALVSTLSSEEKTALTEYTNQSYDRLNAALRGENELTEEHRVMVAVLDAVLARETNETPRRLFRSIRPRPREAETPLAWANRRFPVNSVVKTQAYSSSTVSVTSMVAMLRERPEPPRQFLWTTPEEWEAEVQSSVARNVVLEIVTDKGASVSELSHMPQETEVLLPRHQEYRVLSIDETTYTSDEDILTGEKTSSRQYPAVRIRLVDVALLDQPDTASSSSVD